MIGLEYIVKEFQIEYKEVAESLGISPQTLQDWLKQRRKIPAKRLEQLSNMFGLPIAFFQKELDLMEKGEVAIRYLERISSVEEIPLQIDEGDTKYFYQKGTYENEIQLIKESMENKKKQNNIKESLINLLEIDSLLINSDAESERAAQEPLLSNSSNTETFYKVINIMKDEKISDDFKVMVHLLSTNKELGGNMIKTISPDYREFAKDFLELLEKHQIKDSNRGEKK